MRIDIDLFYPETLVVVNRADGTATVTVPVEAFRRAQALYGYNTEDFLQENQTAEQAKGECHG